VVRCKGQWLSLGVIVDPLQGLVLSIDQLEGEDAQTLQQWIAPIADQVGARVLVSDDADAFKHAADDSGLDQQVCKSHVVRNTEALISSLSAALQNHPGDSLSHLNLSPEQALADLKQLGELIHSRQPQEQAEVQALYERYAAALRPQTGPVRLAGLPPAESLPGSLEPMAEADLLSHLEKCSGSADPGWYQQCRRTRDLGGAGAAPTAGYKREQAALNVSRLIAYCGNHLEKGLDLASLVA